MTGEDKDRTARRHRQEILDFLGIRKFLENDRREIQYWLCKSVFPNGNTINDSLEYVYDWLHQNKIGRPAEKELIRDLSSTYSNFENLLSENISNELSDETKAIIDYCLEDKTESMNFTLLKSDPGKVSFDSVLKEIEKLEFINGLELPQQQLSSLNPKIMSRIGSRALSESSWKLKRHPSFIRYVLMSVSFIADEARLLTGW